MIRGILSEIWVYPIKSLPGFRVPDAQVFEKGLEWDRRLMLVDTNHVFITQRVYPEMALFNISVNGHSIQVNDRSNTETHALIVDMTKVIGTKTIKAVVWDDEVEVMEVNPEYSSWFGRVLKMECKLVCFPEGNPRRIDPGYVKDNKQVSLADGYPFLIIGKESLADLNQRVGLGLSMKRFRPNFVFEGGGPYEEDTWTKFRIGSVNFESVKPCSRCVLTTVDPETGLKGEEPLRTLSVYRRRNGKVYFGQNLIALENGHIYEGDEIKLL